MVKMRPSSSDMPLRTHYLACARLARDIRTANPATSSDDGERLGVVEENDDPRGVITLIPVHENVTVNTQQAGQPGRTFAFELARTGGTAGTISIAISIRLSSSADGIVLLPKLKTAPRDTVELGTWSLLSFLSQRDLFGAYKRGVVDDLLELHRRYESRIRACFVDGTVGLEAGGPVSGTPVPMNMLIAGKNPVAVDGVAAMTMGFDPEDIDHLAMAQAHGLGDWRETFKMHPETVPLPVRPFTPASRNAIALEPVLHHPLVAKGLNLLRRTMR